MDSEHLQTSNSRLFELMVLSLHKELHLRCSLGFRIYPCEFLPEVFWNTLKYFLEHARICRYWKYQIILVKSAKRHRKEINMKSKFPFSQYWIELSEAAIERVVLEKSSSTNFKNFDMQLIQLRQNHTDASVKFIFSTFSRRSSKNWTPSKNFWWIRRNFWYTYFSEIFWMTASV